MLEALFAGRCGGALELQTFQCIRGSMSPPSASEIRRSRRCSGHAGPDAIEAPDAARIVVARAAIELGLTALRWWRCAVRKLPLERRAHVEVRAQRRAGKAPAGCITEATP